VRPCPGWAARRAKSPARKRIKAPVEGVVRERTRCTGARSPHPCSRAFSHSPAAPRTTPRHRDGAAHGAIPSLAGRPAGEIEGLLRDYREGRKTNPVMVSVAQSLDAKETAALAAYFATLPKSASAAAPPR